MADKKTYDVVREHQGDRPYARGETRVADPAEVKHLLDLGVLKEAGKKAEPTLRNKVEPPVANKAKAD